MYACRGAGSFSSDYEIRSIGKSNWGTYMSGIRCIFLKYDVIGHGPEPNPPKSNILKLHSNMPEFSKFMYGFDLKQTFASYFL